MIESTELSDSDLDIIDLNSLEKHAENNQTWLFTCAHSKNEDLDLQKWVKNSVDVTKLGLDHRQNIAEMITVLENVDLGSNKQRFDSRTYTRPKKKALRPSLHSVLPNYSSNTQNNLDYTYSKTSSRHLQPFGESPRFNTTVDIVSEPFRQEYDMHCDNKDYSTKPIDINLSEPAHNLHNTFNKFINSVSNKNNSITNMSPPSLVSSIAMEDSGAFNSSHFSRKSSTSSKSSINENEGVLEEAKREDSLSYNHMDMSILDENEMNTSMLSQFQDDSLTISPLQSMEINTATSISHSKSIMENSLVNSGTFNSIMDPIDDKLPNGQPKFQLRKSFLKPDPEDNFDKFLILNANFNTDDLRGVTSDMKGRSKYDTFRKNCEKENYNIPRYEDDSFLMGNGMSDSFLKETGKESINITYNKIPFTSQRVRTVNRPQMEVEHAVLLPNQAVPAHQNTPQGNHTYTHKNVSGFYDSSLNHGDLPKRDATFKKMPSAKNLTANLTNSDDLKENMFVPRVVDSNKELYSHMADEQETETKIKENYANENRQETSKADVEVSDSRSSSPHHIVPLNMDDLEHLAYEQEQKLYQVVSTPLSKLPSQLIHSGDNLFKQNLISPIHSKQDIMTSSSSSSNISDNVSDKIQHPRNVSSFGSLHKLNASPKRSLPVKRESSAPEIKPNTNTYRVPLTKKFGVNSVGYQKAMAPYAQPHIYHSTEEGLYTSRSVEGSPAKISNRPLGTAPVTLTSSDNQLGSKKTGLPNSKLRQYSSHKELNKIPGPSVGSSNTLRKSSKLSFYASNPVLCPKPLVRQASYTIVSKDGPNTNIHQDGTRYTAPGLRAPTGGYSRASTVSYGQPLKAKHSIEVSLPSGNRPSTVTPSDYIPLASSKSTPVTQNQMKASSNNLNSQRIPKPSGLPRPSSGIPKKSSIRPPSSYSVAPRTNDQTDCY